MEATATEALTAVIDTDLGPLHVTMEEDFGLSGRIREVVTINRVDYGIETAVHLDRQTEEWRVATWVFRVVPTNSSFYATCQRGDQLYERARDGMDEKYECENCHCKVNEEDFIGLSKKDIWLCNDCRVTIIPFATEGD